MKLYPAIDLRRGRVVRLLRGDYDRMTVYADDPAAVARDFAAAGAKYLHVVDLDGAKDGTPVNVEAIEAITAIKSISVEIGGGIRTEADIVRYLERGAARVILGTAAVRDFDFTARMAEKYGAAIAVGVDARDGFVAVNGWLEATREPGEDFCRRLLAAGVTQVIYTDIARDGALAGTNLPLYARLCAVPGLAVTASGGIGSAEELRALRRMGADGAILGKALYAGRLSLAEALRAAEDGRDGPAD